MGTKIAGGAVGGLIGGLVFDALMRLMPVAEGPASMIAFAADAVHASNPLIGWLVYPVYGVVIGALFGWLFHGQTVDDVRAALAGGLYGVGWWIIAELVLNFPRFWPSGRSQARRSTACGTSRSPCWPDMWRAA